MFHSAMTTDFQLQSGNNTEMADSRALDNINMLLAEYGQSPSDYGLPVPSTHSSEVLHEIIQWGFHSQHLEEEASLA